MIERRERDHHKTRKHYEVRVGSSFLCMVGEFPGDAKIVEIEDGAKPLTIVSDTKLNGFLHANIRVGSDKEFSITIPVHTRDAGKKGRVGLLPVQVTFCDTNQTVLPVKDDKIKFFRKNEEVPADRPTSEIFFAD